MHGVNRLLGKKQPASLGAAKIRKKDLGKVATLSDDTLSKLYNSPTKIKTRTDLWARVGENVDDGIEKLQGSADIKQDLVAALVEEAFAEAGEPDPLGRRVASVLPLAAILLALAVLLFLRLNGALPIRPKTKPIYVTTVLYDPSVPVHRGHPFFVALIIRNASGRNLSASNLTLTAMGIRRGSKGKLRTMNTAFAYNPQVRSGVFGHGYVMRIDTKTLRPGNYDLLFKVDLDSSVRRVRFRVQ